MSGDARARRRRRSLWIALAASAAISLSVALAGHLLDDDGGGSGEANDGTRSEERPPPGRACTLIGCTSAVSVRLVRLPPGVSTARVCVEGDCGTPRRVRAPALVTAPLPSSERRAGNLVSVVVELRDGRGGLTRRVPGIARVHATRPNGPDCPPACFQARLRLDASGRLRRA